MLKPISQGACCAKYEFTFRSKRKVLNQTSLSLEYASMMQNVIVWLCHGYIYVGIRVKADVLEWDPPKSGPEKSRPTSSLSWAGRRDNEEHGTTQEMLNCISQDSAAGTRDREGGEYKMHETCALPKVISTAKNYWKMDAFLCVVDIM